MSKIFNLIRKSKIIYILLILTTSYFIFFMQLPFSSSLWMDPRSRHRTIQAVERMVIGLTKDEIIYKLGEPDSFGGVFTGPSRGLTYIIGQPGVRRSGRLRLRMNHEFFIIFLNEDLTAVDTLITRG